MRKIKSNRKYKLSKPKKLFNYGKRCEQSSTLRSLYFMTEVAFAAEKMGHHPNWSNVYNKVDILLFAHESEDSITEKDVKLSKEIDKIFKKE